jgi:hypothetical protein
MAVERSPAAGGADQGLDVLDLSLDGIGLGVAAVAAPAPVLKTVRRCERGAASAGPDPDVRVVRAPFTRMNAGPEPTRSYTIRVPSADVTVFMGGSFCHGRRGVGEMTLIAEFRKGDLSLDSRRLTRAS